MEWHWSSTSAIVCYSMNDHSGMILNTYCITSSYIGVFFIAVLIVSCRFEESYTFRTGKLSTNGVLADVQKIVEKSFFNAYLWVVWKKEWYPYITLLWASLHHPFVPFVPISHLLSFQCLMTYKIFPYDLRRHEILNLNFFIARFTRTIGSNKWNRWHRIMSMRSLLLPVKRR